MPVAPGKGCGLARQGNVRDVATDGGHGRGGVDLVERQDVAVVVTQHVVRGERGLTHGAGLRVAVGCEVRLLHCAEQSPAQALIGQRRVDEQEQTRRSRRKWPDRQLPGDHGAERRLWNSELFEGRLGYGHRKVGAIAQPAVRAGPRLRIGAPLDPESASHLRSSLTT